ncbi:MAG: hypothetical protein NT027_16445 [Proteobacteria bacterium]|nr:hypothetical protein [Pseudomonadota bacterium]
MKTSLVGISVVLLAMLNACGQDASHRDLNAKGAENSAQLDTTETAESVRVKAPKGLMARVKISDLNKESANIEMVAVDLAKKPVNGEEAARIFAAGSPVDMNAQSGVEAVQESESMMLGATQVPTQIGGQVPTQIPIGFQGQQYNDCNRGCGRVNILGGVLNFFGNIVRGTVQTVGNILSALNPLAWFGNLGVGYQNQGVYQHNGYQYYPYSQGPVYNNPTQGNGKTGTEPYPPQYPHFPQQTQVPQIPSQPNQPVPPIGQEPMPNG